MADMPATTLSQLIERIEAATEGSRELDAEVDAALFGGRASHRFGDETAAGRLRRSYGTGTVFVHEDENYNGGHILLSHHRTSAMVTASLDAALMLAPEGLEFEFTNLYGIAAVGMGINTGSPCYARREDGNIILALLAAILRARQTENSHDES